MKKNLLLILFFITANICIAQNELAFVKTSFVIVQSTKDYDSAKATAANAALDLKEKLDLRDLKPHKKSGLTFSKKDCEDTGGYPCYLARGRYDTGSYISIEWSNAIQGFAKGYYVVIAASGTKEETAPVLKKAKEFFKGAYVKQSNVYVGCMH